MLLTVTYESSAVPLQADHALQSAALTDAVSQISDLEQFRSLYESTVAEHDALSANHSAALEDLSGMMDALASAAAEAQHLRGQLEAAQATGERLQVGLRGCSIGIVCQFMVTWP